jgi:hypothetical protein
MTDEPNIEITPPIEATIAELKGMITVRFPDATFAVRERYDPPGISLVATVDIDDTDEVFAVVVDRLVDIQVEEGLPVYVVVLQPIERVMAEMRRQEQARSFFRPTG